MSGTVSARSASLGLAALRDALARAAPRRNGRPVPPDIEAALAELAEASNPDGFADETTLDTHAAAVPPSAHEQVDVATAAARLGISQQAVRKRIAAGALTGRRVGRVWLIEWRT